MKPKEKDHNSHKAMGGKKEKDMKKILFFCVMFCCANAYADTETIKWYSDGSVYDTTTCQSGGDVILPTPPTKRGHTFDGWIVALHDFSTLNSTDNGSSYTHSPSAKTWTTVFYWGQVYGVGLCSIDNGNFAVAGTPDETTSGGAYCWCRATGYKPQDSNIEYEPTVSPLSWVFSNILGSAECESSCTHYCGYYVRTNSAFRQSVFGVTQ